MKHSLKIVGVLFVVGFVAAMSMQMGCEELSKAQFTVAHETEPFVVDLDDHLAQAQADGKEKNWDEIPGDGCITLEVDKLRDIFYAHPNDVNLEEEDTTGKVAKYKDNVLYVDIDELKYVVMENSLSFDIPWLELYIGDLGAVEADMAQVTKTAPLAAKETGERNVEITDEIVQELAGRLEETMTFSFAYKVIADEKIEVCPNESLGSAKLKAIIKVTVTADAV